MLNLMENVVKHGTAVRLVIPQFGYGFTTPIAGKTGTTQNHSDGWFMGITKDITAGVWVGGEDRSIHFDNMAYGQGANMALPIWGNFFLKVYKDKRLHVSQDDFDKPANFFVNMNCEEEKQEIKEDDVEKVEQE
jgi:penicillin-binding protein 1A